MLLWAESFEYYGLAAQGQTNMRLGSWIRAGGEIQTEIARTGGRALKLFGKEGGQYDQTRIVQPANNELIVAFGYYVSAFPAALIRQIFSILGTGDAVIAQINVGTLGEFILRGPNEQVLIASSPCLSTNTWHHIEVRTVQDNVIGQFELRVDGEVVISMSNLNLGDKTIGAIAWGSNNGATPFVVIDDIVVVDTTGDVNNTFPGPARVLTSFMTSSGPANGWLVTGAPNAHTAVSEIPQDGDASYIRAEVAGDTQEFGVSALPPETASVAGVFIPFVGKLDDAGAGTVRVGMTSGGETELSSEITLGSSYSYRGVVIEKDPATGTKFTKQSFEDATIRIVKAS